MPTKKTTKKTARKAAKKTTKQSVKGGIAGSALLYGPPIWDAIARGDLNEMRQLAVLARKQIKEVQTALRTLEAELKKSPR